MEIGDGFFAGGVAGDPGEEQTAFSLAQARDRQWRRPVAGDAVRRGLWPPQ